MLLKSRRIKGLGTSEMTQRQNREAVATGSSTTLFDKTKQLRTHFDPGAGQRVGPLPGDRAALTYSLPAGG